MSSSRGVDPELLGKLAERLSEAGKALKALTAQSVQTQNSVTELLTRMDAADARIKNLEVCINGNGAEGLKTRLAVAERDIDSLGESDLKARVSNVERDLSDVKNQKSGSTGWGLLVGVLAAAIAFASMMASCGPQLVKAWSPTPTVIHGPK